MGILRKSCFSTNVKKWLIDIILKFCNGRVGGLMVKQQTAHSSYLILIKFVFYIKKEQQGRKLY